jgi:Domain of unknown function (DUF222)/HNH endonuclease
MFSSVKALLYEDPVESLPRPLLADRFEAVRGLEGAIEAYKARLLTATDRLDDSGLDGAGMLRTAGRASSSTAARAARRAESLELLPATRNALAQGRITAEHVDAISAAADTVSPEQADEELVEQAASAPADVFAKRSREWSTNRRNDDGADEYATQHCNRRGHTWIRRDNKMRASYLELDRESGDAVHAVLQQRYDELWNDDGGRDGADEIRTPEQRMADAFVSLVTGADSRDDRPPHPKHQINVIYDIAGQTSLDGRPLATLVTDGEPLPREVRDRIACNATVTAILFDGPGKPIWRGRDLRHATIAQWKALIARDRGCVGCGAAPNRCEAHHIVPWEEFGPTDIDNLVLVCSRCHHDLHDRGMNLRRTRGGWRITAGDKTRPARDPTWPDVGPDRLTLTA